MLKVIGYILLVFLFGFSSIAFPNPPMMTQTIELNRGKILQHDQIAAIANINSARDQAGNPVTLDKKVQYTLSSFTRTTLSLMPPGGGLDDLITLDFSFNDTSPPSGS